MKKTLVVFATILLVSSWAQLASARTFEKCDDSVPPVCDKTELSGRRHPQALFERVGIKLTRSEAEDMWKVREIREAVMKLWRAHLKSSK